MKAQIHPLFLGAHVRGAPVYQTGRTIVHTLQEAGHEAFIVGGFVRGALLKGESFVPSDLDIATSARPEEIRTLFRKVNFVGQSFGVSLVHLGGHSVEVATFRTEGPYSDGRRPDFVRAGNHFEDSCRRDFTINALYFDPTREEIIDFHDGVSDASQRILRTVGKAADRFAEDLLRVLRMCRFAAQDGLTIEPLTWQAAMAQAPQLTRLARERVVLEIQKTPFQSYRSFCCHLEGLGLEAVLWSVPIHVAGAPTQDAFQFESGINIHWPMSSLVLVFIDRFVQEPSAVPIETCAARLLDWPTTVEDRRIAAALLSLLRWLILPEKDSPSEAAERIPVPSPPSVGGASCEKVGLTLCLAAFAHLRRFAPLPFGVLKSACAAGFGQRISNLHEVRNGVPGQMVSAPEQARQQIWLLLLECCDAFQHAHAGAAGANFKVSDLFSHLQTMSFAGLDRRGVIQLVQKKGVPSASQVLLDVLAVAVVLQASAAGMNPDVRLISACAQEVLESASKGETDLAALVASVQEAAPRPFS